MKTLLTFCSAAVLVTGGACSRTDRPGTPPPVSKEAPSLIVTADSVGAIRIGMPADSARVAAGIEPASNSVACGYLDLAKPYRVMVVNDSVARFDVRDSSTATLQGARVGDSIARIERLFAGRMRTQPHKYTNGKYLIVRPGPDTTREVVFETDTLRVTMYRAGRLPVVEWVEGCG